MLVLNLQPRFLFAKLFFKTLHSFRKACHIHVKASAIRSADSN